MRLNKDNVLSRICCLLIAVLALQKEYHCYHLTGIFGCRDVYIWLVSGSVNCKYLIQPSKHGIHSKSKYYCTKYQFTRCCETCSLLKRHNYAITIDAYKATTDETTRGTVTIDAYKPTTDETTRGTVTIDAYKPTTDETTRGTVTIDAYKPTTDETTRGTVTIDAYKATTDETTTETVTIDAYKSTTDATTTGTITYTSTSAMRKATPVRPVQITFFSVPDSAFQKQFQTTNKSQTTRTTSSTITPLSNSTESTTTRGTHSTTTHPTRFRTETASTSLPHITHTVPALTHTYQMIEQSTTIPSTKIANHQETQTPATAVATTEQTPLSTALKPTSTTHSIHSKDKSSCKDRHIWIGDGSVNCKFLIQPSKHAFHLRSKYYCTKYPLTSCCETCSLLKRRRYALNIDTYKPTTTDSPPAVAHNSTSEMTTHHQMITTDASHGPTNVPKETQTPVSTTDTTVLAPSPTTLKTTSTKQATTSTTVTTGIAQPLKTTTHTTTPKDIDRPGCVDVGIWIVSGSVPCSYLQNDNRYGLNKNQLYFCNKYPLTSCCKTCALINRVSGN